MKKTYLAPDLDKREMSKQISSLLSLIAVILLFGGHTEYVSEKKVRHPSITGMDVKIIELL